MKRGPELIHPGPSYALYASLPFPVTLLQQALEGQPGVFAFLRLVVPGVRCLIGHRGDA